MSRSLLLRALQLPIYYINFPNDLTIIEAVIISGRSRARLVVRSKPVKLNIYSILVELLVIKSYISESLIVSSF